MGLRQGSGFTSLQQYLNANKDTQLGSVVGKGISGTASSALSGLGESEKKFEQESEKSKIDVAGGTQAFEGAARGIQSYAQGASDKPAFLASPEQQKQLSSLSSTEYKGPKDLENQSKFQSQAESALNLAKGTKTSAGREAALQRYVGNTGYSQGERTLDNILLGAGPQQDIQKARMDALRTIQQASSLGQRAKSVYEQGQQAASQLRSNIKDIYERTLGQGQVGSAQGSGILGDIARRGTEFAEQSRQEQDRLARNLESNIITKDQMAQLGLDPNKDYSTYKIGSLSRFLTSPQAQASLAQSASGQQAEALKALESLYGQGLDTRASQIYGSGQLGSYLQQPKLGFDVGGFTAASEQAAEQFAKYKSGLIQQAQVDLQREQQKLQNLQDQAVVAMAIRDRGVSQDIKKQTNLTKQEIDAKKAALDRLIANKGVMLGTPEVVIPGMNVAKELGGTTLRDKLISYR